jgi:hypothetical protein
MSFTTKLPARLDDTYIAPDARLQPALQLLPTLGTIVVLAVAALLAAGAPAGGGAPGSTTLQPARVALDPPTLDTQAPVFLVLIDSADDEIKLRDLDPMMVGDQLTPLPALIIIDLGKDGFEADAAREIARLEQPFRLIDLRGP